MSSTTDEALSAAYAGASAVVFGGMGFIGSALARRLAGLGCDVLAVDAMLPDSGAHLFNLEGAGERVTAVNGDVRDQDALPDYVRGRTYLFNMAAQTSHQGSMQHPFLDQDINARAPLAVLEACRAHNPSIRIVFASTRQLYGKPDYLPIDEKHPVRPPDVNAVNKLAAEEFHRLYLDVYGLKSCSLRLTNTYGPRMRIKDAKQNFVGIWLKLILENKPFEVWGGHQLRDFSFVDDCVDAFLYAGLGEAVLGKAFNIGGGQVVSLLHLAQTLIDVNGGGSFELREFPAERKKIDIGDYHADDAAFRAATEWAPRVALKDGLAASLAFYRAHFSQYA